MVVKWCQSKHVRLITKCYPPRTANPPKPNSSELSYLTYYAYTTPSKLKKVGRYLEHRAQQGLTKGRTGDVIVTLDICTALIKKCYRDLGLFASNIVAILQGVLNDGELVLMEHSVLTLKAFCDNHDGKLLTVSQPFRTEFYSLCRGYAQYGVGQDDTRAQCASLDAVSAIISSEAFCSTTGGGQLKIIVSPLVQILAQSSISLDQLQSKMSEEMIPPRERRQSFFTREVTATQSGSPRSSMQLDYTEEENSLLALKNLRQICEMNNASLLRIGLDTLMDKLSSLDSTNSGDNYAAWAVKLVMLVLAWLPIQYRYLALLSSLEDLDTSKRKGQDKSISTPKQELILTIVEGILTTGESLIGLNVIDVLNTLISKVAVQLTIKPITTTDVVQKLVNCIIGLSGHIYYTDQIRDICSAIMEWSRPLYQTFLPVSGKLTPALEEDEDAQASLDIKVAAVWSLRALKGVLLKGGGSVSLEEVWTATEGALAGQDGEVRMTYVDAMITHMRSEDTEQEDQNGQSATRFLTMIHVPMFMALKRVEASVSDYLAIWVLLMALLGRFQAKEVVKGLPMMWRLLDVTGEKLSRERKACVDGIFLGFLAVIADMFKIVNLKTSVEKEIELRKTLDEWPVFIDPAIHPGRIAFEEIMPGYLVFPAPTEPTRPLPPDLQRSAVINTLAFSSSFPETFREHLLVQWSEETSMPDYFNTPDTQSERHPNHRMEHLDSHSTSIQSRSLEDNHPNYIHARKKSLQRHLERAPSPATHINQLRRVLAGGGSPRTENVPKIEVNGEKLETPPDVDLTPEDEKNEIGGDVTMILQSLKVNGEWNEKAVDGLNENGETIRPPYGI